MDARATSVPKEQGAHGLVDKSTSVRIIVAMYLVPAPKTPLPSPAPLDEQGPPLAENLRRVLEGRPMKGFQPQKAFLGLISTGDDNAVLSWRGLAWGSAWMWTFKDYIDRKWMKKYKV